MQCLMRGYWYQSALLLTSTIWNVGYAQIQPRVTIVIIVDQLSFHHLDRIQEHLHGGIGTLWNKGISYLNAYHPHGMPGTAPGHTALSTGTYPKDHGIISNKWVGEKGKFVACDDDPIYGKSAHKLMVDGLSDQFRLSSKPHKKREVISISIKSRAAILMANKMGKALWFDPQIGQFVSSGAYYATLPDWVVTYNNKLQKRFENKLTWKPFHPESHPLYQLHNPKSYEFSRIKKSLWFEPIFDPSWIQKSKIPFKLLQATPLGNNMILELAHRSLEHKLKKEPVDELLLWISLSSLDKLGHVYGHDTKESLDLLAHIDDQIKRFMKEVYKLVPQEHVLFVLSSDHGGGPILELMRKKGYHSAQRIDSKGLMNDIRTFVKKQYEHEIDTRLLDKIILGYKTPYVYLNHHVLHKIPHNKQQEVTMSIKRFIERQPGIKKTWTYRELERAPYKVHQIENFFKMQLYRGRSGDIIIQTFPYNVISKWDEGISHKTPYDYDTHVPIVLYQPGHIENKKIYDRVWTLQLANTLAQIMGIQKPSASTFEVLPGVF